MASIMTWDLYQFILKKAPQYLISYHKTQALNKDGNVVDELHFMVSQKNSSGYNQNSQGSRNDQYTPYQQNSERPQFKQCK
jgi:hypothetical protein